MAFVASSEGLTSCIDLAIPFTGCGRWAGHLSAVNRTVFVAATAVAAIFVGPRFAGPVDLAFVFTDLFRAPDGETNYLAIVFTMALVTGSKSLAGRVGLALVFAHRRRWAVHQSAHDFTTF